MKFFYHNCTKSRLLCFRLSSSPEPAVPGSPEPAVPGSPKPAVPGSPEPAVPGSPKSAVPGSPEPAAPGSPEPAVPGVLLLHVLVHRPVQGLPHLHLPRRHRPGGEWKGKINLTGSPETNLIDPDFTISVYGSSCNYIFFGLILGPLLSLSFYFIPKAEWDAKR